MAFNPLNWLLGLFSLDVGIDLGTANTLVHVRGKGIVINEPSWVAMDKRSRQPMAIGLEAKEMVGRTSGNIIVIRPLRDGVISEFEITARYSRGKVQVEKQTIDGTTEEELRLPVRFHSYDMVLAWLRAVPLVSGTSFRDNLVIPFEFRTVPVKFLVLGTKLISTRVGDIMCREVVLILPTREVRFWYELAQPHRFVGLNDTQNDTKMVLESFRASHADSLLSAP